MPDPVLTKLHADAGIVLGDLWRLLTPAKGDGFDDGREGADDGAQTAAPIRRRTDSRGRMAHSNGAEKASTPLFWHFID